MQNEKFDFLVQSGSLELISSAIVSAHPDNPITIETKASEDNRLPGATNRKPLKVIFRLTEDQDAKEQFAKVVKVDGSTIEFTFANNVASHKLPIGFAPTQFGKVGEYPISISMAILQVTDQVYTIAYSLYSGVKS